MGEGAGDIPYYCFCGCCLSSNRFNPVQSSSISVAIFSALCRLISSDNYPGFSKWDADFLRGNGIPKCSPEISINSHAISNLRWLLFDLGAALSTMFSRIKRGIVYMQSSLKKKKPITLFSIGY